MHGEPLVHYVDNEAISEAPSTVRVDSIPLHGGSSGMQDMLNDIFAMHDVCVEEGGSQVGVEAEAEAEAEAESVEDEIENSNKGANKLRIRHSMKIRNIVNWELLCVYIVLSV
jgi:hypothetical protein